MSALLRSLTEIWSRWKRRERPIASFRTARRARFSPLGHPEVDHRPAGRTWDRYRPRWLPINALRCGSAAANSSHRCSYLPWISWHKTRSSARRRLAKKEYQHRCSQTR